MIKFVIKVVTAKDVELVSKTQEAPNEEIFGKVVQGLSNIVDKGLSFTITDDEGDEIIIPPAVIQNSIIMVIRITE
jgi:hypothetical protein